MGLFAGMLGPTCPMCKYIVTKLVPHNGIAMCQKCKKLMAKNKPIQKWEGVRLKNE